MRNQCFICYVKTSICQFCNQKYINRFIHHSISWLQTNYHFNDRTLIWKILRDESNDSTAQLAETSSKHFMDSNNSKSIKKSCCLDIVHVSSCLVIVQHCRVHLTGGLTLCMYFGHCAEPPLRQSLFAVVLPSM